MDKKDFFTHITKNIIPFWNRLKDDKGGFFGYVSKDNIIDKDYDKGVILNNRILWFYSNAYILFKDDTLLMNAAHAYRFLKDFCYDKEYEGVYWSMTSDGIPSDTTKHTYNQAFAVYALSSYYLATENTEALNLALKIFDTIEEKMRDKEGYLEAFTKDFKPHSNEHLSENGVEAYRTMNTALHILESYTELYRVSKNKKVKERLYEILSIFKDKIYNPDRKIMEVFFDKEYHTLIDLESYGHEIEASWLISRAIEVLGDTRLYDEFKDMILSLVSSVYERGMDKNHASIYYEAENGIRLNKRAWWVMAEGVVGFYNAYLITKNNLYLKASEDMWDFINKNMMTKYGEWKENFWDTPHPDDPLVHPWKCPYHNGRMCMEMIKRLRDCSPSDKSITDNGKKLYEHILKIRRDKKLLFGHENDTFMAVSPNTDSDVRAMCGDIPSLFGIDTLALFGYEMDPDNEEASMKKSIKISEKAFKEGAIITLSMHMPNFNSKNIIKKENTYLFNKCTFQDSKDLSGNIMDIFPGGKLNDVFTSYLDKVAYFLSELENKGISVILRPLHEGNGNWFYWGTDITDSSYISLYIYIEEYFKKNGIHNALYVYSPNGPIKNKKEYLKRYPGDSYIDILAFDYYDDYKYKEEYRDTYFKEMDESSKIIYELSLSHDKIPAISECGIRVSKDESNTDLNGILESSNPMSGHDWFNEIKRIALKYTMPYYLIWGDFDLKNTYLPYIKDDGTPHEMVSDFLKFYNSKEVLFAKENKNSR